jgi:hypothetical protein
MSAAAVSDRALSPQRVPRTQAATVLVLSRPDYAPRPHGARLAAELGKDFLQCRRPNAHLKDVNTTSVPLLNILRALCFCFV